MNINLIKEKLSELKSRDKHFTVFGSETHRYINQPVSLVEIEIFEKQYEFELPEIFRLFLLEIGSGAGPYYGIRSLKEISRHIESWFPVDYLLSPIEWSLHVVGIKNENPFGQTGRCHPQKPFPLTQYHVNRINERLVKEDWEFVGECGEITDFPLDGNILICDPGCHYEISLVTSGELLGDVWNVECDGKNSSWIPESSKNNDTQVQNITFENWYEHWLDVSLSKFINK